MTRQCKICDEVILTKRGAATCQACQEIKRIAYQAEYQSRPEIRAKRREYMRKHHDRLKSSENEETKIRRKTLRSAAAEAKAQGLAMNEVLKQWGEPLSNRRTAYEKPKI